jgi:ADP-ribosylation factor 1/2
MGWLGSLLFKKRDARILMIGLDNSGKTTILYKLKLGVVKSTLPTVGFNVETVNVKGIELTVWDLGGQDKIRPLWEHYYHNAEGIIFVVDSNDKERLNHVEDSPSSHFSLNHKISLSAAEELAKILYEPELAGVPLLILANKQDLPNAVGVEEVAQRLGISSGKKNQALHNSQGVDLNIRDRNCMIQPCIALTGEGLLEGFEWLAKALKKRR